MTTGSEITAGQASMGERTVTITSPTGGGADLLAGLGLNKRDLKLVEGVERRLDALARATSLAYRQTDELLREVQPILKAHLWAWAEERFGFKRSSCENMMRVAARFADLSEDDIGRIRTSALAMISRDSAPPEAVRELLDRAADGEQITFILAKRLLGKHAESARGASALTAVDKAEAVPARGPATLEGRAEDVTISNLGSVEFTDRGGPAIEMVDDDDDLVGTLPAATVVRPTERAEEPEPDPGGAAAIIERIMALWRTLDADGRLAFREALDEAELQTEGFVRHGKGAARRHELIADDDEEPAGDIRELAEKGDLDGDEPPPRAWVEVGATPAEADPTRSLDFADKQFVEAVGAVADEDRDPDGTRGKPARSFRVRVEAILADEAGIRHLPSVYATVGGVEYAICRREGSAAYPVYGPNSKGDVVAVGFSRLPREVQEKVNELRAAAEASARAA